MSCFLKDGEIVTKPTMTTNVTMDQLQEEFVKQFHCGSIS